MNKFVMTAITAAALAAGPISASAEAVAVSLSASFGGNLGTVSVADENIIAPTSVAVAGAAGVHAVASSVATRTSSGAAAGATELDGAIPFADVGLGNDVYETEVSFIAPAQVTIEDVNEAIENAIDTACGQGLVVDNTLFVESAASGDPSIFYTLEGDLTVNCNPAQN